MKKAITDLSKAVMTEGEWFIVPAEHANEYVSMDRNSVIVHQCNVWNAEIRSPDELPYEPLGYWTTAGSVEVPCKLCNVRPPEAIAHLFLLHNFDTFAGDHTLNRWDSLIPSQRFQHVTHQLKKKRYFVHNTNDDSCPCSECRDKYGVWE